MVLPWISRRSHPFHSKDHALQKASCPSSMMIFFEKVENEDPLAVDSLSVSKIPWRCGS